MFTSIWLHSREQRSLARSVFAFLALAASCSVPAQDLLDPMRRDEDISGVRFNVAIQKMNNGKYRYDYNLASPENAKGTISSVKFDVLCESMPDIGQQRIDDQGMRITADNSKDGRHPNIETSIAGTAFTTGSITWDNELLIQMANAPGGSTSFSVVSDAAPSYIPFRLGISAANEHLYHYWSEGGQLINENYPWYNRWEIHGIIQGPSCSHGHAYSQNRPSFGGLRLPEERREIDSLLRYSVISNRNRFRVPSDTEETTIQIYYGSMIDEKSFKASANGMSITHLFSPSPGSGELVTITLNSSQTLLEFSVRAKAGVFEDRELYESIVDSDQFEIRKE